MRKATRVMAFTLAAVALGALLAVAGFIAWVRIQASGTGDLAGTRPAFYDYPAVPERERREPPRLRVARVGDRLQVLDGLGRVLVLHGVVIGEGTTEPPWRPIGMGDQRAFDELADMGVNAVRLALPWEALEQSPRRFNLDTLAYVRWFLDQARRRDMMVLLDNYQVDVSRCFGGVGAPVFAHPPTVVPEAVAASDCRVTLRAGLNDLPNRLRWWAVFWEGGWGPDDLTLQDHLIWAWQKLAEVVRGHPALLGYIPLHAPLCDSSLAGRLLWPGAADCRAAASDFFHRFARAIRAVDPDSLLFVEPPRGLLGLAPAGEDAGVDLPPVAGVVLSVEWPVDLDADCDEPWRRGACGLAEFLDRTGRLAGRLEVPRVLAGHGVHGCRPGAGPGLSHQLLDVEDAGASSFAWGNDAGSPGCFAGAFVRPVPRRIAGEPVSWGFDRTYETSGGPPDRHHDGRPVESTDSFTLTFRQVPGLVADTHVFVPRSLLYGEDPATEAPEFTIDVSDGQWRWAPDDPDVLVWTTNPEVPEHVLTIRTWGGARAPGLRPCP